uniref:Uncharacterized protein n=1 Tax=Hyaloperonospora arabidopsidis (strain Emoy2) TaxID=559515 RepID=M4BTA7_HYAAE
MQMVGRLTWEAAVHYQLNIILCVYAVDWLSIGKSFATGKREDTTNPSQVVELSESALQVQTSTRVKRSSKKEKKKPKEKRRRLDEETTTEPSQHLLKLHKKKKKKEKKEQKSKKKQKSLSSCEGSDNSVSPCTKYRSERRRQRGRSRSRSQPQSRTGLRSYNDASDMVVHHGQVTSGQDEKLFEFDRMGDCDNKHFGSTYVHDQPLYQLATQRNLLTGAWENQVSTYIHHTKGATDSGRYFSLQARKLERNARQRRLYLAYSEKRQARAVHKGVYLDSTGAMNESRPGEMTFIPLDPVLDIDALVSSGTGYEVVDDTPLLTTGQSVEQHLVRRSKTLNAAIAANSQSSSCWLDLMAFQEQTINLHTKPNIHLATKTSILEKQAAILARALAVNPQSRELHRVKLNMLLQTTAKGDNSDVDLIQLQIEGLLSEDPANSELWLKLLQCRHQRFGEFSVQSVRDLYARILTVLRAQSTTYDKATAASALPAPNLSGKSDLMVSATRVEDLSIVLLDFHFLMCVFEKKAGYVERAISQLQALLDFGMMVDNSNGKEIHADKLREFAIHWNDGNALRIGSERLETTDSNIKLLEEDEPETSISAFRDYVYRKCVTTVDHVNPSKTLRSNEHKQNLLSSAAVYQRGPQSKSSLDPGTSEQEANEIVPTLAKSAASDKASTESKKSSTPVYSNLHGYRIIVDEADDSKEYERILNELRGTENSRARQTRLLEQQKMRHVVLAAAQARVEDQRASYDQIYEDDLFVRWLAREEAHMQMQWAPLLCNNSLHRERIEQQPDRATLTEEVQPFLFYVSPAHRWRIIAELLQICGVHGRSKHLWSTHLSACDSIYADNYSDYELLAGPILSVLNLQAIGSSKHALFLNPADRTKLLENALLGSIDVKQDVLRDPSKVVFVRRVFAQALDIFHDADDDFESKLKCLWVGFEAKVACMVQGDSIVAARRLSQTLAQKSANGETDFDVLYAYAKLELTMGNVTQVRRICESTLHSLLNRYSSDTSLSRVIHRFVFLHARLEMWSSAFKSCASADYQTLRCLYTLWFVWQPVQKNSNEIATLSTLTKRHQKRTQDYLQRLLLSDPSNKTNLIAKYRVELKFALRHCVASNLAGSEIGNEKPASHDQLPCWAGYCLHNLALVVYICHGFEAACREYRVVLADAEHQTCSQVAWIWTCYLEFMQQHQVSGSFPTLAPREWRQSVYDAVDKFPLNELFLRLFVDSEMGNTISQVHRTYLAQIEERWRRHFDSPKLVEWLFALLCEFCRIERAVTLKKSAVNNENSARPGCCLFHYWDMNLAATNRIRQIFESMVRQIQTKGNALCWRLYMRFEVALGKVDAAKKILYRGIAACAWSKALYMDGLRVMRAYLTEAECKELLNFMESKGLYLRVEIEEEFDN